MSFQYREIPVVDLGELGLDEDTDSDVEFEVQHEPSIDEDVELPELELQRDSAIAM